MRFLMVFLSFWSACVCAVGYSPAREELANATEETLLVNAAGRSEQVLPSFEDNMLQRLTLYYNTWRFSKILSRWHKKDSEWYWQFDGFLKTGLITDAADINQHKHKDGVHYKIADLMCLIKKAYNRECVKLIKKS